MSRKDVGFLSPEDSQNSRVLLAWDTRNLPCIEDTLKIPSSIGLAENFQCIWLLTFPSSVPNAKVGWASKLVFGICFFHPLKHTCLVRTVVFVGLWGAPAFLRRNVTWQWPQQQLNFSPGLVSLAQAPWEWVLPYSWLLLVKMIGCEVFRWKREGVSGRQLESWRSHSLHHG